MLKVVLVHLVRNHVDVECFNNSSVDLCNIESVMLGEPYNEIGKSYCQSKHTRPPMPLKNSRQRTGSLAMVGIVVEDGFEKTNTENWREERLSDGGLDMDGLLHFECYTCPSWVSWFARLTFDCCKWPCNVACDRMGLRVGGMSLLNTMYIQWTHLRGEIKK